jgi:hypothetical protein
MTMMGRFCKTCKYLKASREKRMAFCSFWTEFAKAHPRPWAVFSAPEFHDMGLLPRHVWDDLPPAPEMAGIDTSCVAGPWSEVMDCATWEERK